jgi:hypothetical protein
MALEGGEERYLNSHVTQNKTAHSRSRVAFGGFEFLKGTHDIDDPHYNGNGVSSIRELYP